MRLSPEDTRIRALRPDKTPVDPRRPLGTAIDHERRGGRRDRTLTVFLAGSECPFTCTFCDLWRQTLDGPTPPGALPSQIAQAVEEHGAGFDRIKLYNASNWFDPRAVPTEDLPAITRLLEPFPGVTVEAHARMVGPRTKAFSDMIAGRLEVAIGLETTHPSALAAMNKQLTVDRFDRAAEFLEAAAIDLRVFVLVGVPGVPPEETVEWTVRAVLHAQDRGAGIVTLIPVRTGNGEMNRLEAAGEWASPSLTMLERAHAASVALNGGTVLADLWDAEALVQCQVCGPPRITRLRRINAGESPADVTPIHCSACDG